MKRFLCLVLALVLLASALGSVSIAKAANGHGNSEHMWYSPKSKDRLAVGIAQFGSGNIRNGRDQNPPLFHKSSYGDRFKELGEVGTFGIIPAETRTRIREIRALLLKPHDNVNVFELRSELSRIMRSLREKKLMHEWNGPLAKVYRDDPMKKTSSWFKYKVNAGKHVDKDQRAKGLNKVTSRKNIGSQHTHNEWWVILLVALGAGGFSGVLTAGLLRFRRK